MPRKRRDAFVAHTVISSHSLMISRSGALFCPGHDRRSLQNEAVLAGLGGKQCPCLERFFSVVAKLQNPAAVAISQMDTAELVYNIFAATSPTTRQPHLGVGDSKWSPLRDAKDLFVRNQALVSARLVRLFKRWRKGAGLRAWSCRTSSLIPHGREWDVEQAIDPSFNNCRRIAWRLADMLQARGHAIYLNHTTLHFRFAGLPEVAVEIRGVEEKHSTAGTDWRVAMFLLTRPPIRHGVEKMGWHEDGLTLLAVDPYHPAVEMLALARVAELWAFCGAALAAIRAKPIMKLTSGGTAVERHRRRTNAGSGGSAAIHP